MATREQAGRGEIARTAAAGGSLTLTERRFVDHLIDPFAAPAVPADVAFAPRSVPVSAKKSGPPPRDLTLDRLGAAAGLRKEDIDYIIEWVVFRGVHWLACESASIEAEMGARVFRNPAVRRIINFAAERGFCRATSALKEELEDFFTQRMRATYLPEATRDNAADKLAKLKGFYPDAKNAALGGTAAVQIVIADPYRMEAARGNENR